MIYELECGEIPKKSSMAKIITQRPFLRALIYSEGHLQFKIGYENVNICRCFGASGILSTLSTVGGAYFGKPSFVINFGGLHFESIKPLLHVETFS